MPTAFARVIIAYSFSGTASKRGEGSFTIQSPPTPATGRVSPFDVSMSAENFSWTPASENRNGTVTAREGRVYIEHALSFLTRFRLGFVNRVSLLPEKFCGP